MGCDVWDIDVVTQWTSMRVAAVVWAEAPSSSMATLCQAAQKPTGLLPVANTAVLEHLMAKLEEARVRKANVVVEGERAATQIKTWSVEREEKKHVDVHVTTVKEGAGSADAVRAAAADAKRASHVLLMPAELLLDVPLAKVVAQHRRRGALATIMLMPAQEGNAPRVAVDQHERIAAVAQGGDDLAKVPKKPARQCGRLRVCAEPRVVGLAVLSAEAVAMVCEDETIRCVFQDLLPKLCQAQFVEQTLDHADTNVSASQEGEAWDADALGATMAHNKRAMEARARPRKAVVAMEASGMCLRHPKIYAEANREMADRAEDAVAPDAKLGHRATIGPGCVVGPGGRFGDRSSVKRSVLGSRVHVGQQCKIIQSVLHDNVSVQDGAHLQNCIIASGTVIPERTTLKDCLVGPGANLVAGGEFRNETLIAG